MNVRRVESLIPLAILCVLVNNFRLVLITPPTTLKDVVEAPTGNPPKSTNRRKFVSYQSSAWEQLWLDHIDEWVADTSICDQLLHNQSHYLHDFLNLTCTSRMGAPYSNWCVIDDHFKPLWYNTENRSAFDLTFRRPIPKKVKIPRAQPVLPTQQDEHIVSKFTFEDETTGQRYVEYIEPLVSHLRHPLAKCLSPPAPGNKELLVIFRGYVIPPPFIDRYHPRSLYFDAGASSWSAGAGGPSLEYFTTIWGRQMASKNPYFFDHVYAFEATTSEDAFYASVPEPYRKHVTYRQLYVSSQPQDDTDDTPFLPFFIKRTAKPEDYVLFKLDIDSPDVEEGSIHYLLDQDNTHALDHVDEIFWEHHVRGNYLLKNEWQRVFGQSQTDKIVSLRESYDVFLKLRQKGIRAHSWV